MFALFAGQHDSYHLVGIFDTKKNAELCAIEADKIYNFSEIKELKINEFLNKKAVPIWNVTIDRDSGEILKDLYLKQYCPEFIWEHNMQYYKPDNFNKFVEYNSSSKYINVCSQISEQAAIELAIRVREKLIQ